jgi:hypothetical protein
LAVKQVFAGAHGFFPWLEAVMISRKKLKPVLKFHKSIVHGFGKPAHISYYLSGKVNWTLRIDDDILRDSMNEQRVCKLSFSLSVGVFSSFALPLDPSLFSKGKQFLSNKIHEYQSGNRPERENNE